MKATYLIPLALFLLLLVLFWVGLGIDPRTVPSPLIDKPVPTFSLPTVAAPQLQLTNQDLQRQPVALFNVWASWCVACRQEHPFLMQLMRRNEVPIYGLNYKDERGDALAWLRQHGNPYVVSAFDYEGRVGIDWGVYGVPETFVVDASGTIRHKHIGPLTPKAWQERIAPLIAQIRAEGIK